MAEISQNQPTDSDVLTVQKAEYEKTLRELKGYKGKITQLQAQLYEYQAKQPQEKPVPVVAPTPPPEPAPPQQAPKEEEIGHDVTWFPQFCPDCGVKNPTFKDEAECVDCKIKLGAESEVQKLKSCPNCGGQKYTVKKK